jgi:hypothetical protein
MIALSLTLAIGMIGSLVTLTGIAHAYESANNNHKGALTVVTAEDIKVCIKCWIFGG